VTLAKVGESEVNSDYLLVAGLLLIALSIPSLLQAYSSMDPPRMGAVLIILGLGLVFYAARTSPQGYAWDDVPNVFFRVLGEIF
jgi:hypothetical protein